MKHIVVAGNVGGKDAVVRTVNNGDSVTSFSVAVQDRSSKTKDTIWFDVSIWGKRGEALAGYITRGSKITVAGDLGLRVHDGKTYLTIRADDVALQGSAAAASPGPAPAVGAAAQTQAMPSTSWADDEIPF